MNIEDNKAYFAALTDGLKEYLPEDFHFDDADSVLLLQEAKELMGGESHNTHLGALHSIMPTIAASQAKNKTFPIVALEQNQGIFPDDELGDLDGLLNGLRDSAAKIKHIKDSKSLDYTLYSLLYRHTSRIASYKHIPESGQEQPVISLFDKNRTLAAVTACLEQLDNQTRNFYLVKGDLSGIQSFIYANFTLENPGAGGKAAKRLRGRSFLVALLTDYLAEYIVSQLDLFKANIVFAGGGHFNLLLPATADMNKKLNDVEKKINHMLLDVAGMTTSLVLAKTPINKTANNQTPFADISDYYFNLNAELEKQKSKRYKGHLLNFMLPQKNVDDLIKVSSIGMDMGERIPRTNVLAQVNLKTSNQAEHIDCAGIVARLPGTKTVFIAHKNKDFYGEINQLIKDKEDIIESVKIIQLNKTDLNDSIANISQRTVVPISYGFTFVGKYAPTFLSQTEADAYNREENIIKDKYKPGDVKPFDLLAGMSWNGGKFEFTQLAVVRLDIDNLGCIFMRGLGNKPTFQRLATLSRELHQFFSGYVNELAEKYQIYITYSGGDDAFVVGSWYNVLHFTLELKKQFDRFVCNNKNITFSAGIFICHPHYPVIRFAKDAEECEKAAKGFENKSKNAIHLFDHTLTWDNFKSKMEFADTILHYIEDENVKKSDKLARSLIHRLLRILRSCIKGDSVTIDGKKIAANVARLHYLFARHNFTHERIEKAKDGIERSVIKVILDNFNNSEKLNVLDFLIAYNYVIMKTRKMK